MADTITKTGNVLDDRFPKDVAGTVGGAIGQTITFYPVKSGRDKGLMACGKCQVAFHDDWMVKHVNWHFRGVRLRR